MRGLTVGDELEMVIFWQLIEVLAPPALISEKLQSRMMVGEVSRLMKIDPFLDLLMWWLVEQLRMQVLKYILVLEVALSYLT